MSSKKSPKPKEGESDPSGLISDNMELPKILSIFLNDDGRLRRVSYVLRSSDSGTLSRIILDLRQLFGVAPRNEENGEEQFRWSLYDLNRKLVKKKADLYFQPASTFQLQRGVAEKDRASLSQRRRGEDDQAMSAPERNALRQQSDPGTLFFPVMHQSRSTTPTDKADKTDNSKNFIRASRNRKADHAHMGWMLGKSTLTYRPTRKPRAKETKETQTATTTVPVDSKAKRKGMKRNDSTLVGVERGNDQGEDASSTKQNGEEHSETKTVEAQNNTPVMTQGTEAPENQKATDVVEFFDRFGEGVPAKANLLDGTKKDNQKSSGGYAGALFGGPALFSSSLDRRNSIPLSSWYVPMKSEYLTKSASRIDVTKKATEIGAANAESKKKTPNKETRLGFAGRATEGKPFTTNGRAAPADAGTRTVTSTVKSVAPAAADKSLSRSDTYSVRSDTRQQAKMTIGKLISKGTEQRIRKTISVKVQ